MRTGIVSLSFVDDVDSVISGDVSRIAEQGLSGS